MSIIPKLSFCITCKNRIHQISKTLRRNLNDNRLIQDWVEFILIDFGSYDGLKKWISKGFKKELKIGYLKYYYTDELLAWHASIAKNTAHYYSSNDILVNLDCDNFTGFLGGQFVIRKFLENSNIILHQFSGNPYDGTFGRISMRKDFFKMIGGYDESFEPMGYQDKDLIERLKRLGLTYVLESNKRFSKAILNSKEEGIKYTNSKLDFISMNSKNQKLSKMNILNGKIIANNRNFGIKKNMCIYKV